MLYRVCLAMGRIQTHWLFLKYLYKFLIQYIISKMVCFSVLLQFTLHGWDPVGTVYTTLLRYVNRTTVECMLPMVTNGDNFVHVYRVQVRMYSTGHVYFKLSKITNSQAALITMGGQSKWCTVQAMYILHFPKWPIVRWLWWAGNWPQRCTVQTTYILHFQNNQVRLLWSPWVVSQNDVQYRPCILYLFNQQSGCNPRKKRLIYWSRSNSWIYFYLILNGADGIVKIQFNSCCWVFKKMVVMKMSTTIKLKYCWKWH